MKKALRIIFRAISGVIIFVILLPIVVNIVLQLGPVQGAVVDRLAEGLSRATGSEVRIGGVDLEFFSRGRLRDVLVADSLSGRLDTLIYVGDFRFDILGLNFFGGSYNFGDVELRDVDVRLADVGGGDTLNVVRFFRRLDFGNNPPQIGLSARSLSVLDSRFSFRRGDKSSDRNGGGIGVSDSLSGVDFRNFGLEEIDIRFEGLRFADYGLRWDLTDISMAGPVSQGVSVGRNTRFRTKACTLDSSGIVLNSARIESLGSDLSLSRVAITTDGHRWRNWRSFADSVTLDLGLGRSLLSSRTIGVLTGHNDGRTQVLQLDGGQIRGHIGTLSTTLRGLNYMGTTATVSGQISDLPRVKDMSVALSVEQINSSGTTLLSTLNSKLADSLKTNQAAIVQSLDQISGSIDIRGRLDSLGISSTISSSTVGSINSTCAIVGLISPKPTSIQGQLSTSQLSLRTLLGSRQLGKLSLSGNFCITLSSDNRHHYYNARVNIAELDWHNYKYQNITLSGGLEKGIFTGDFVSLDPNFLVNIHSTIDLSSPLTLYDFSGKVERINLHEIKLNPRDSISLLSATVAVSGSGMTLDDFNGTGTIDHIHYINPRDTIRAKKITIESTADSRFKELEVDSEFMHAQFRGSNSFAQIVEYIEHSANRFMPAIPQLNALEQFNPQSRTQLRQNPKLEDGYYQLSIEIKRANNIAAAFVPSLEIAEGSTLNLLLNPAHDQFNLSMSSDFISSEDIFLQHMEVDSRNIGDSISLYSTAELIIVDGTELPNFSLMGGLSKNYASLWGQYYDQSGKNSALLSTNTHFNLGPNGQPQATTNINSSSLMLDSVRWNISPASITIDSESVRVRGLAIHSDDGRFELDGCASASVSDTLNLRLSKARLEPLSVFIAHLGYKIRGTAEGTVSVISALGDQQMLTRLTLDSLGLNEKIIGSPRLLSSMDRAQNRIRFTLGNPGAAKNPVWGNYNITARKLSMDMEFDSIAINYLDPLLVGITQDNDGWASTDLTLTVHNGDVSLDGTIDVRKFNTTVSFTQARYSVSPFTMPVRRSSFYVPLTTVADVQGNTGTISGEILTTNFMDMRYKFRADFTDLMALNTTKNDNEDFYGRVYGTGFIDVSGSNGRSMIDIVGQTANNSNIVMPFSGASTIEKAEFIRFVNPRTDTIKTAEPQHINYLNRFRARQAARRIKNKLVVNLNVQVKPNLLAELELDAKLGDIIRARGQGRLMMTINPELDVFTLEGPVEITEGNYLFTLQTIINKRFTIDPGSSLIWTGDPTNPDVNLTAIYKLKTSVGTLTGDVGQNTSTNIDCGLVLTDKLLSPTINFNITAPSADAEIQNALRNTLNTQEALSMQFLSLMLANSFMPDMGAAAIGTMGSNIAGITGVEFLSNQLTNLISSDKVSVRFGYKPYSEMNSDEFSAGVGAQIIADVLSLEVDGNYNTGNNESLNNQNPFSVDAYLTWNINKSGTLKMKGFTRTIDRFDESQGRQENGVGVYFRQDFHNFPDLQQRLKTTFSRDSTAIEERRAKREKKKAERKAAREQRKATTKTTEKK